jgi:hypothetical protein
MPSSFLASDSYYFQPGHPPRAAPRKNGDSMLDDLVDRYGEGAIVTVSPYVLDSGETFRWSVQIDGKEVSDIDVRVDEDPETGDQMVMRLFHADEELEIERWSKTRLPYGPGSVIRSLRQLQR